jgi:hypothetical protein
MAEQQPRAMRGHLRKALADKAAGEGHGWKKLVRTPDDHSWRAEYIGATFEEG